MRRRSAISRSCSASTRRRRPTSCCRRTTRNRPGASGPASAAQPCHHGHGKEDPVDQALSFLNPYRHGFARVAVAVPRMRVADPVFNAAESIELLRRAAAEGAVVVAFPELGLSAYTCDDLFHQRALLDACETALGQVAEATAGLSALAIVGLPLRVDHRLFNCAA